MKYIPVIISFLYLLIISGCQSTQNSTIYSDSTTTTEKGNIIYFIYATSDTIPITKLDPSEGTTSPEPCSINNATHTISDVEILVGFHILEPAWFPQTLTKKGANSYKSLKSSCLFYEINDPTFATNGIFIRQQENKIEDKCIGKLCGNTIGVNAIITKIQIGNTIGEYVEGIWKSNNKGFWIWEPDPYQKRLRWKTNGMALEISLSCPPDYITTEELIRIAESIK